ncbi:MAG: tetratricopeptide repeat protein [Candidatus Abyssubacteria bacterium]
MKAVLSLSLMLFLLPAAAPAHARNETATVPAAEVNNIFDIANEEYKAGNYEVALKLYEGLLADAELKTADMYYNLGNTYFKLGQLGNAIAAYRRALRIAPRDKDIEANLRHARNTAKDKLDRPKSTEVLRSIFFFHYGLSRSETEAAFLCTYTTALALASLYMFWKPRPLRWLVAVTALAACVFGGSTAIHAYHAANPREAVVVADKASIRTGPGEHYLTSFDLHDGAELEVRTRTNGWYQVALPDGRRGWLKESKVIII